MNGEGVDVEMAMGGLALCLLICVWAALVMAAQVRMRSVRRLREHAELVARARGIDRHPHGILVDRRNARTTITWFEDGEFRRSTQQWSNRFDAMTSVGQWYNGGTETARSTGRTTHEETR